MTVNFFLHLFIDSVMYILSNEEPLWMTLCLKGGASGFLQYKGSWKKTALHKYDVAHSLNVQLPVLFIFIFNANIFGIGYFECSLNLPEKYKECHRQQPLHFDGNNSDILRI
jgi:hypothetical protein